MERLSELLQKRMEMEGLSVRRAADKIGVSHSTVARAANGQTVEVDTLVKLADFLGVEVLDLLDVKETPDEVYQQISMVISMEPELEDVFKKIAEKIEAGELEKTILDEVAAFAAFRLQQYQSDESKASVRVKANAAAE